MSDYQPGLSRREALIRAGTLTTVLAMQGCSIAEVDHTLKSSEGLEDQADWPHPIVREVSAAGYGTDPNLINPPAVPWPNVLTTEELSTLAELAEFLCPGAKAAGVPEVVGEWVSAPYPMQSADRDLLVPGLVYVGSEARVRYAKRFVELSDAQLEAILVPMIDAADAGGTGIVARFMGRLRGLVAGAYFSSQEGSLELGYLGNRPIAGPYPGPSDEAEAHLQRLLEELQL